MYSTFTVDKAS